MLRVFCSDFALWPDHWRAQARQWLSDEESDRLTRIHSSRRRDQFLAGRLLLRQCAAEVFACRPADIQLAASAPVRARHRDGNPLCFVSISHSGNSVTVALGAQRVGVDCERLERRRNWRDICAQYFAPGEAQWLLQLPADTSQREFLRSWTVKEALSKCSGAELGQVLAGGVLTRGMTEWAGEFSGYRAWSGTPAQDIQVGLVCEGPSPQLAPDCRYRAAPEQNAEENLFELTPLFR